MRTKSRSFARAQYDVAIVGAGPAGAMAAIELAASGIKTILIEKSELPRYKVCGGGVLARAKKLLPSDLTFPVEREIYTTELNLLDSGFHFAVHRDFPVIYMTMRSDFDAALVEYARRKGAVVRDSCEVEGIENESHGITLRTSQGTITSRFVVAADGARGIVMKKLGLIDTRYTIPAVEWEMYVDDAVLEKYSNSARFDFGATPQGYGWIFPKKDHLSVGLLTIHRGRFSLKKATEEYASRFIDPASIRSVKQHGFVIPIEPLRAPLVQRGMIIVGDAAGLADPLTAEGITHALLSGKLAARAIIEGEFDERKIAKQYQRAVDEQILKELNIARVLAKTLYTRPLVRRMIMNLYGHSFCESMTNVITGRRNYRELLLNPAKYIKLLRQGRWRSQANENRISVD